MKKLEVRGSAIHNRGLFAAEPIKAGERIQYIRGSRFKKVVRGNKEAMSIMNSIGTGRYSWIDTDGTPFRYINHSCEPNAAIVGTKLVVARRNIKKGEEITMDYSMTDADPYWQMTCKCGARTCRKKISSIQSVPPEAFKRHMPLIPRNFQKIYIRDYVSSKLGVNGTPKRAKAVSG